MKIDISKQTFINNFVTQCCSQWFTDNYFEYCFEAQHDKLSNPPLEDIYFCAEEIWKKIETYDANN